MQVSLEAQAGLERRLTIQLPEQQITQAMTQRLQKLMRQVKVDGFRPGKAPLRIVQQRYGAQIRDEALGELVEQSITQAVRDHALRPVGPPRIEPLPDAAGLGFQFAAVFEVYPEISLPDFTQISLQQPVATVNDADVDAMIERLQRQRAHWHEVERGAAMGDRLSVWMQEEVVGGDQLLPARDRELVLGAPTALPAVYDALLGVVAGETRRFSLTVPEDHPQASVAGKQVNFEVRVKRVEASHLPEVDAAFMQAFGVERGEIEAFRAEVRANMERELQQAIRKSLKNQVMDALARLGADVPLPQTLVDQDAATLAQQTGLKALPGQDAQMQLPQTLLRDQARRRVLLGLMLGQIVAEHGIKLDDARLHSTLQTLAASYEHPDEVVRWYYSHPEELRSIQSVALEDQVVDWLLARAQVSEQPLGFFDLVQPTRG